MSTFTLAISCLTTSNFALIHGPDIPGSYAILLFIALDFVSITSHIHTWVLFLLWLLPLFLSGVISPLISSSILDTYWPGEFLIQYPIILPFHTVRGVLKARILKWFAIPFSSEPYSDPFLAGLFCFFFWSIYHSLMCCILSEEYNKSVRILLTEYSTLGCGKYFRKKIRQCCQELEPRSAGESCVKPGPCQNAFKH